MVEKNKNLLTLARPFQLMQFQPYRNVDLFCLLDLAKQILSLLNSGFDVRINALFSQEVIKFVHGYH